MTAVEKDGEETGEEMSPETEQNEDEIASEGTRSQSLVTEPTQAVCKVPSEHEVPRGSGLEVIEGGKSPIQVTAEMIENAGYVVALTGAGLSADSGVPDFRSPGGIWTWYEPSVYASLESFLDDPSKFWEMVQDLIPVMEAAQPNPAHIALAEMEKMGRIQTILAQNIDELITKAGCTKDIRLHGNLLNSTCLDCGSHFRTSDVIRSIKGVGAPHCPECYGRIKPDVVLFNEPLRPRNYKMAKEAALKSDVMLVIGSSLGVYPVAEIPVLAKKNGADVVIFDIAPPDCGDLATLIVPGRASETLPALLEECKIQMGLRRGGE